jgi:hypothetical protein
MKLALYVVARKSIQLGPLGSVSQSPIHSSCTGARQDSLRRRPSTGHTLAQLSARRSRTHGYAGFPNGFAALGCAPFTSKPVCVYESPLRQSAPPPTKHDETSHSASTRRERIHIRTRRTYAAHPSTTATHMRAQQAPAQRLRTPLAPA